MNQCFLCGGNILFIHFLSVALVCFHLLAIINNECNDAYLILEPTFIHLIIKPEVDLLEFKLILPLFL